MKASPLPDGSLRVEQPDENTRYDMGNHRLFVQANGRGDIRQVYLCDGFLGMGWQVECRLEDELLRFNEAHAIGRLWELRGGNNRGNVALVTWLNETDEVLYQQLTIANPTGAPTSARVHLQFDAGMRQRLWQRVLAWATRRVPAMPGLSQLWGLGWAKFVLPGVPRRMHATREGILQAEGKTNFTWGASQPPDLLYARGKTGGAVFQLTVSAGETCTLTWAMTAGDENNLRAALQKNKQTLQDTRDYARWLSNLFPQGDALLRSLVAAGVNAAVSMFKEYPGGFAGLVAGPDYAHPPRLYFRDGYWTAQALLHTRPDLVRRHLLSLAQGVHADGSCPSGVFAPHYLHTLSGARVPLDWLPDHYDSPAFFVLMVNDYAEATGDWSVLNEPAGKAGNIWQAARQTAFYLTHRDADGDGLIEKPYAANDWADNVRRSVWVTYDQALYAAALLAAGRMASHQGENEAAARFEQSGQAAITALNHTLWDEASGHYINYTRPGFSETHLSLDTLLVLHFGLAGEEQARRSLDAARKLQTRNNPLQTYGDWGVQCVFPYYRRKEDLFSISADPCRYHNGSDWPYLDGIYGGLLLARSDPDWRYVLTRWWEHSLEQGWLTPVEYFSPPYPAGGLLQGWSSLPAAMLLQANPASEIPRNPRALRHQR